MIKCVILTCGKEAEYIYFGKSLCEEHFEQLLQMTTKIEDIKED